MEYSCINIHFTNFAGLKRRRLIGSSKSAYRLLQIRAHDKSNVIEPYYLPKLLQSLGFFKGINFVSQIKQGLMMIKALFIIQVMFRNHRSLVLSIRHLLRFFDCLARPNLLYPNIIFLPLREQTGKTKSKNRSN